MGQTPLGITYPDSGDHTRLWEHFATLAGDVDGLLGRVGGVRSYASGVSNASVSGTDWTVFTTFGSGVLMARDSLVVILVTAHVTVSDAAQIRAQSTGATGPVLFDPWCGIRTVNSASITAPHAVMASAGDTVVTQLAGKGVGASRTVTTADVNASMLILPWGAGSS